MCTVQCLGVVRAFPGSPPPAHGVAGVWLSTLSRHSPTPRAATSERALDSSAARASPIDSCFTHAQGCRATAGLHVQRLCLAITQAQLDPGMPSCTHINWRTYMVENSTSPYYSQSTNFKKHSVESSDCWARGTFSE